MTITVSKHMAFTLAELKKAIDNAIAETGRDGSEIYIDNHDLGCLGFVLEEERLTDGSIVYNARF